MKRSYVWMITALVVINIVCLVMIIFHGGDQERNGVFVPPPSRFLIYHTAKGPRFLRFIFNFSEFRTKTVDIALPDG